MNSSAPATARPLPSRIRQRLYFEFPDWAGLNAFDQEAVEQVEEAWLTFAPPLDRAARDLPQQIRPHRLIAYLAQGPSQDRPGGQANDSKEIFLGSRTLFDDALASAAPEEFIACLENLASVFNGEPTRLRRKAVFTSGGPGGISLMFPQFTTVPARLAALHAYLREGKGPVCLRAMVAMAAITNSHPFLDCNGRVARTAANLVLNQGRAADQAVWLSLADLGSRPPGNLTLHVREAELHGAWPALVELLGAFLRALAGPSATRG